MSFNPTSSLLPYTNHINSTLGNAPANNFSLSFAPMYMSPINPRSTIPTRPKVMPTVTNSITTVFVGNISEKCTDEFIKQMLEECGEISNWKRIQGTNGKFQAFGFCDYDKPEGTMRALRVLNDFPIADKKLVVKIDPKMREQLRELAKMRIPQALRDTVAPDDLPCTSEDLAVDEQVRLRILSCIEIEHPELLIAPEDGELSDKDKEGKERERRREDKKDRRRRRSDSRARSRSPRRKARSHKRRRHSSSRSSSSRSSSGSRSRSSSSGSDSSRGRRDSKRRSRSRGRRDSEDSDEAREKRLLRKQAKEKEEAYKTRLKKWEDREKRMAKQYEKEEQREKARKLELMKEAKRMKAFLEDYDDEKDDLKYYKSSSLFARRRDTEKERELDAKDRQKEQQELEELKKQILEENKGKEEKEELNVEEEARKRHQQLEEEAARKRRDHSGSPNPHHPLGQKPIASKKEEEEEEEEGSSSGSESASEEEKEKEQEEKSILEEGNKWTTVEPSSSQSSSPLTRSPVPVSAPIASLKLKTNTKLKTVFGDEEDEDMIVAKKKLKPFEITQEERLKTMTPTEIKKMQKDIADSIPSNKEILFATELNWKLFDKQGCTSRIRPWVTKKIKEYIGEEEPTLVDFICEKIENSTPADQIMADLKMVLDDEAEIFVLKLWRLLVYEHECSVKGIPSKTSQASS